MKKSIKYLVKEITLHKVNITLEDYPEWNNLDDYERDEIAKLMWETGNCEHVWTDLEVCGEV